MLHVNKNKVWTFQKSCKLGNANTIISTFTWTCYNLILNLAVTILRHLINVFYCVLLYHDY